MPASKPYPLVALLKKRKLTLDQRALSLAQRTRLQQLAGRSRSQAEQALSQHQQAYQQTLSQELEAQQDAPLCVSELQRMQAWQSVQCAQAEQLRIRLSQALEQEQSAKRQQEQARHELAQAHGDQTLLRQHEQRYLQKIKKMHDSQREDEAQDQFDCRKAGGRP